VCISPFFIFIFLGGRGFVCLAGGVGGRALSGECEWNGEGKEGGEGGC
jgi:hypothetical protein